MNFKRYLDKIKKKTEKIQPEIEIEDTATNNEIQSEVKKIPRFVDPNKDPNDYLKRYINESKYKDWFNRNYPNYTIYEAVGKYHLNRNKLLIIKSLKKKINQKKKLIPR